MAYFKVLQGDPTLSTSLISLKAMWKALRERGEGVFVELGSIEVPPPDPNIQALVQKILDQFH